jgi:hypothetical protein
MERNTVSASKTSEAKRLETEMHRVRDLASPTLLKITRRRASRRRSKQSSSMELMGSVLGNFSEVLK